MIRLVLRDEEHKNLFDKVFKSAAIYLAIQTDEEIKKRIINSLMEDTKFIDWFRDNYEFSITEHRNRVEDNYPPGSYTMNKTYSFSGPTLLPFWTRINRKLSRLFK